MAQLRRIFETAGKARNFEFGKRINLGKSHLTDDPKRGVVRV